MSVAATNPARVAIDIGSTVVKVAKVGADDSLMEQSFFARDFKVGIATQVESILSDLAIPLDSDNIIVCSSANGGLRVGIVCLSKHFSGAAIRNQALLAGANPVYLRDFDEPGGDQSKVDILIVAGGIDCGDAGPLEERLRKFDPGLYRFGALAYAGNASLAAMFVDLFPGASVIGNPLAGALVSRLPTVFEAIRRAYLDDLVYKEGVSELRGNLSRGIRPTPEIANRGFQRAVFNRSSIKIIGACVVIDIGGATTDLHYTVEIIRGESEHKPSPTSSIARYVFADLGIVASRESALLQIRTHSRLYEFLSVVQVGDVQQTYQSLREGEFEPSPQFLSYACLFLALDRFSRGDGPGLPTADVGKIAQFILTGGAAQTLDETMVDGVVGLFAAKGSAKPIIMIDRKYQLWVDGITWADLNAI